VTGLGRTGKLFGFQHWEVVPDMIVLGKGITSGHLPLSAVVVRSRIVDAFYGEPSDDLEFRHVYTYGGYPAGCAAALATIDIVENEQLAARSASKGADLLEELRILQAESKMVGDVRGLGLLLGMELVEDRETKKPFPPEKNVAGQVESRAREKGVLIRAIGANSLSIHPALNMPDDLLDQTIKTIKESVKEIEAEMS
jgi:adenosylmethionine-8-amino-7-oxononanoate aminotransferase